MYWLVFVAIHTVYTFRFAEGAMVITAREIVVFNTDEHYLLEATNLATELGLPVVHELPVDGALMLSIDQRGLSISRTTSVHHPLRVDFTSPTTTYRRRFGGGRGQAIARAVGLKGGRKPRVLDATAGLGRDSFILASLGCNVIMIERSPIMAALLSDGLSRGRIDHNIAATIDRISLFESDAINWIHAHEDMDCDVVYIDPMFPARTKSALVKGDMQLLHALIGVDEDIEKLLSAAMQSTASRVVVKRPKRSTHVAGITPDFFLQGKSSRFDVYLT